VLLIVVNVHAHTYVPVRLRSAVLKYAQERVTASEKVEARKSAEQWEEERLVWKYH
jgi:hypothetical protein